MFKRLTYILVFALATLVLFSGCDDDSTIVSSSDLVDASRLFGFSDGRVFNYLQTDTLTTVDPFLITITEIHQVVRISGDGDDWVIWDNNTPLVNLKITANDIIQNGYWREVDGYDSLFYFAAPPVVVPRRLAVGTPWDDYTPHFVTESEQVMLPFCYANFGFYFTRELVGIEEVLTPYGAFNAHRFDVSLYVAQSDEEPIATSVEYFAPDVGLVKLNFSSGPLQRSLAIVSYSDAVN